MSKEHSSKTELQKAVAAEQAAAAPRQWGPIAAVLLGFVAYKLPEWVITALAPVLVPLLPYSENTRLFVVHALFEALAIGALFMLLVWFNSSFKALGLGAFKWSYLLKAVLGWSVYFVIIASVMYVVGQVIHIPDDPQEIGYANPEGPELALIFLILVCIVPIAEELLFRGFIYRGVRSKFPFWVAALTVSVLFGVAHGQLNVGIDTFCLSLVLCYLVEKTNSLWPGILVHALKNAVAFTMIFVLHVG